MTDADVVGSLNRTLRQGERRALELEDKLAALVEAVLDEAADVAADNFRALAVDHLAASARARAGDRAAVKVMGMAAARSLVAAMGLTAAVDVQSNSTMVCLKPRPEEAEALADMDGYPAENLHVTLCYLGEVDGDLRPVADTLAAVAATHAPLVGMVGGYGQFATPDGPVGILLPDVPGLVELRVRVAEALMDAGVEYAREHGFQPHVTVDDEPEAGELEEMLPLSGQPLHFDALHVVRGDREEVEIPLVGAPALTAAAGKPYCLPAALRTKTDPVRREVIKTMMKAALEGVGLSFDVTNPLVARILAKAASQITYISRTTQLEVMRIIRAAYEEGLSIDDTAKAIRGSMKGANPARARLIARTELVGATNGGSLSAAQIVAKATGVALYKTWLTAAGSKHPRHHKYIGLSGQTKRLDDYFQVGRASLEFPGDPSGPGEEVCNCRCALIYTDNPSTLYGLLASAEVESDPDVDDLITAEVDALTAAGSTWSSPDPDQVLNVSCGARTTRTSSKLPVPGGAPAEVYEDTASAAHGFVAGIRQTAARTGKSVDEADLVKAEKTWAKRIKGSVADSDAVERARDADAYNRLSPMYVQAQKRFGTDRVLVIRDGPVDDLLAARELSAGKRMTGNGVTIVRDEATREKMKGAIQPGDVSSLSNGGIQAVLRHEYGHQIWEEMNIEQRTAFRALLPSDHDTLRSNLTLYGTDRDMESFCETFAIVSDPDFDGSLWADWVGDARHLIQGVVDAPS